MPVTRAVTKPGARWLATSVHALLVVVNLHKLASTRNLYALHRWISLLVVLQLAIWAASGLVFALIPSRSITSGVAEAAHEGRLLSEPWLDPEVVLARVPVEHRDVVFRMELRRAGSRASTWRVPQRCSGWSTRPWGTTSARPTRS